MKRRNRKRSSKSAGQAKAPVAAETTTPVATETTTPVAETTTPVAAETTTETITPVAAETITPVAAETTTPVAAETTTPVAAETTTPVAAETITPVATEATTPVATEATTPVATEKDTEKPAAASVAPAGADRRTHPRYEFTAAVEVVTAGMGSGTRIETRVRDLSQQGCYVDTDTPFPLQTVTDIRMTKRGQKFEARARVVYSQVSKGMGLVFTAVAPEQLVTLETWLAESRETSWLAANRRRSQRVLMKIPVRVSGQNAQGLPFEEETLTLAVSAHGALLPVSTQVKKGQRLALSNVQTKSALECVVAHIRRADHLQLGVEFTMPNPTFWHVAFPPKDWTPRHPDAKSPVKGSE